MADEVQCSLSKEVISHKNKDFPRHRQKKRNVPKLPKRDNDVYVTNKTNFQAQLSKCRQLFLNGENEIVIHGLGAAVNRAANLALTLKDKLSNTVEISVNTSTVQITDEYEPLVNSDDYEYKTRSNSAIHVRVYRVAGFAEPTQP